MHCSHVAVITNKNEYAALHEEVNNNANNLTAQLLAVVECSDWAIK